VVVILARPHQFGAGLGADAVQGAWDLERWRVVRMGWGAAQEVGWRDWTGWSRRRVGGAERGVGAAARTDDVGSSCSRGQVRESRGERWGDAWREERKRKRKRE